MQSDYAKRILEAPGAADAGDAPSEAPSCASSFFDGVVTSRLAITRNSREMLRKLYQEFANTYDTAVISKFKDDIEDAELMRSDAVKRTIEFVDQIHATFPDDDKSDV